MLTFHFIIWDTRVRIDRIDATHELERSEDTMLKVEEAVLDLNLPAYASPWRA